MRPIDERVSDADLLEFAERYGSMPDDLLEWYEQSFSGHGTVEFYQGLLAGFTYAFQMVKHKDPSNFERAMEYLTVYVSRKITEMREADGPVI